MPQEFPHAASSPNEREARLSLVDRGVSGNLDGGNRLASAGTAPAHLAIAPEQPLSKARFKVLRDFSLHFDHRLGAAEAKRRVKAKLDDLKTRFAGVAASTDTWSGDTLAMRVSAFGQTANATVAIGDESVDLRVHLPLVLAPLGGNVQSFLAKTGAETLK